MQTKFQKYLNDHGYVIEKQMRLSRVTVKNWKNLISVPTVKMAYMLLLYSHGDLTLDDIYLPYAKKKIGGKKFKFKNPDYASQLQLRF